MRLADMGSPFSVPLIDPNWIPSNNPGMGVFEGTCCVVASKEDTTAELVACG